ncbi:hypothetical protein C791_0727 [Amycolatopsis azurea DSM 43854]|uniref:Uncharacterized protein n=1 Tax=Amycolatopsis azurea DSM 43854 TaxID=1238180 RepID=M2PQX4_9PSEU|nr:hypothetical protein C791_0727 [Amycolatopsis azurea DSM 43854]
MAGPPRTLTGFLPLPSRGSPLTLRCGPAGVKVMCPAGGEGRDFRWS